MALRRLIIAFMALVTRCETGFGVELGGAVRCGLQHPVVTENDHQERPWAFFAPAKCLWFRELEAQITSNSCHELKHATLFVWRCDLKMNFSGTTNY